MIIQEKLQPGKFLKRYKRFFADVQVNDRLVVAHVPNTGSLKSCLFEGANCVVSESANPHRKLKATLHFVQAPTSWVGVNTSLPNQLVHEAWAEKKLPAWRRFSAGQREFKISADSRLDLVLAPTAEHLRLKQDLHYIEIKNVTYAKGDIALFPDAVTTRGQKHLNDLMALKEKGFGAELLFIVQRHDCRQFGPADDIDPDYGQLLRKAIRQGVTVRAFACDIDPQRGVSLNVRPLEMVHC